MSSKIKVLQVIPKLSYGGAEIGCYDLAHYLYENNCSSYIVTSGGALLKYINRNKVRLIRLPVQSKNPILMLINSIIITFIILICNINIVHARSRAPAWSCLIATKITLRKFVTTFHGTYNFNNRFKKYYNSGFKYKYSSRKKSCPSVVMLNYYKNYEKKVRYYFSWDLQF